VTAVGVIGLGVIGGGVARALHRAGNGVVVCDVDPVAVEALADESTAAATPAELAAQVEAVVVAVVNDAQVTNVLTGDDGVLSAAAPGTAVIIVSTIGLPTLHTVAVAAAAVGVDVIDCGVTGGPTAAAKGELVCMVGGSPEIVEAIRPVLAAFSSLVERMGPLGAGMQAKLARATVLYGGWVVANEALRLAEAAGVDVAQLDKVVRESEKTTGGSTSMYWRGTAGPWAPDADPRLVAMMKSAADIGHKDLRAAIDLADSLGVSLPVTTVAETHVDEVFGFGDDGTHEGAPAS